MSKPHDEYLIDCVQLFREQLQHEIPDHVTSAVPFSASLATRAEECKKFLAGDDQVHVNARARVLSVIDLVKNEEAKANLPLASVEDSEDEENGSISFDSVMEQEQEQEKENEEENQKEVQAEVAFAQNPNTR
jgi:hypothetical protein